MGSLVSVIAGNLVMEEVETRARASSSFLKSVYMDDTSCSLPETNHFRFWAYLNSIELSIHPVHVLTREGWQFAVLDVHKHYHSDSSISTLLYRNPTHTDFHSHLPLLCKAAFVHTLCSHVDQLCSSTCTCMPMSPELGSQA